MARTDLPRLVLVRSTPLIQTAGTAVDPANGHSITPSSAAGLTLLVAGFTFAGAKTLTVKAGTPGANGWPAGAALGDLVVSLNNQTAHIVFESHRYLQPDGSIYIDIQAGATGTLRVYSLPY
jgi:hypothetical protein